MCMCGLLIIREIQDQAFPSACSEAWELVEAAVVVEDSVLVSDCHFSRPPENAHDQEGLSALSGWRCPSEDGRGRSPHVAAIGTAG